MEEIEERKEIIQKVSEQINLEHIKYLLWYGNRPGKDEDFDLLAVVDKRARIHLYESPKSKLDILTIGKGEFRRRLNMFDPAITEPVITGFLLMGDETEFGLLISKTFLSSPLLPKAIQFLKQKARERLEKAHGFLEKGKDNSLSVLANLSWACSYSDFAAYYDGNGPKFVPITFVHLLAQDGESTLGEVMRALRAVKSGREIDRDQVVDLFKGTQKMLGVVN